MGRKVVFAACTAPIEARIVVKFRHLVKRFKLDNDVAKHHGLPQTRTQRPSRRPEKDSLTPWSHLARSRKQKGQASRTPRNNYSVSVTIDSEQTPSCVQMLYPAVRKLTPAYVPKVCEPNPQAASFWTTDSLHRLALEGRPWLFSRRIRESVRPFRGALPAPDFPLQGVNEAIPERCESFSVLVWGSPWRHSGALSEAFLSRLPESLILHSRQGSRNLHCPRVSRSESGAAPLIEISKNAKRFRWAVEMLGRRLNTVKIGISAVFGPKPWTPPRRAENGLPTAFDDAWNGPVRDARPESRFQGFWPSRREGSRTPRNDIRGLDGGSVPVSWESLDKRSQQDSLHLPAAQPQFVHVLWWCDRLHGVSDLRHLRLPLFSDAQHLAAQLSESTLQEQPHQHHHLHSQHHWRLAGKVVWRRTSAKTTCASFSAGGAPGAREKQRKVEPHSRTLKTSQNLKFSLIYFKLF